MAQKHDIDVNIQF